MLLKEILFLGLLFLFLQLPLRAVATDNYSYTDTNIKAAYIMHLINFVKFPDTVTTYKICVVGDDLIGIAMADMQKNSAKNDVAILKKAANSNLDECNFVFLSNSAPDDARIILYKTNGLPVVTISDIARFSDKGGIFEFVSNHNKIGININIKNADEAKLKIDPNLKAIANRVIQ